MGVKLVTLDVWETLLKTRVVIEKTALCAKPENPQTIIESFYKCYPRLRWARLIGDMHPRRLVSYSQELVAKTANTPLTRLVECIEEAFSSVGVSEVAYLDALNTIPRLASKGYMIAVIGNTVFWPSSLTRSLLDRIGLSKYMKAQVYSDEVGVVKPDRRIFHYTCRLLDASPREAIHVGDNVSEDVGGALSAGMYAALVRRGSTTSLKVVREARLAVIPSLESLEDAIRALTHS